MLKKTLESSLDCREIEPVSPKGNLPYIFIGRTDAETEAPILRPPDARSLLIAKDPDTGKDWRQKEKRAAEDEMVGWHHDSVDMNLSKLWEMVKDREAWHSAVHGVSKIQTRLSNWNNNNNGLYRDNQAKPRSLKWALIQYEWSPFICFYCCCLFILTAPHSLWDLSSLSRKWTQALGSESRET